MLAWLAFKNRLVLSFHFWTEALLRIHYFNVSTTTLTSKHHCVFHKQKRPSL